MPDISSHISAPILDHYRCVQALPKFGISAELKEPTGFFRFGQSICYGQAAGATRSAANGSLFDASQEVRSNESTIFLPFDLKQVLDNLRYERYVQPTLRQRWVERSWARDIYYHLRPMFPVAFRKHLQKLYLKGWDTMAFPTWPVDRSVDILFDRLLLLAMEALDTDRIPFIWFWPDSHQACAIVTHDVETKLGRDFCEDLMDIDDAFGIKASYQIVPEKRYAVPERYLQTIRERGCEVNVHGLDHEGNLFQDYASFKERARKINEYGEKFGSRGFRSPILYRNLEWFQELNFSYDMSVPNVARLQAQRGGCCTVMPYFLPGNVLELPLTTIEDYSLFHILDDYSIRIWKQQMSMILEGHGLISFISHPDYLTSDRPQAVYKQLLEEIGRLRSQHEVWVTLPGEVDRWWRARSQMKLAPVGSGWRVEGPGSERAKVAYARRDGNNVVYEIGK